jgi:hydrogenase maturation factor
VHFTTGELIEIVEERGARIGRIRVRGAVTRVDLSFVPDAKVGDTVLAQAGVAISVMVDPTPDGDIPLES